jgi:hypothetical protein
MLPLYPRLAFQKKKSFRAKRDCSLLLFIPRTVGWADKPTVHVLYYDWLVINLLASLAGEK